MAEKQPFLLGSTFPLSLIRRAVQIVPADLGQIRQKLKEAPFVSFWGHQNTLNLASELLHIDVRPTSERPALSLSTEKFPMLDGQVFKECWVLSPDYIPGFRPRIGSEVEIDQIRDWQVLRIRWEDEETSPHKRM